MDVVNFLAGNPQVVIAIVVAMFVVIFFLKEKLSV